jgi:hypothetical protein
MRPARTDNAWSTFIAVALFLLMAATWAFIPPTAIRNAWIAERAAVYAIAGKGESDVYGRTLDDVSGCVDPQKSGGTKWRRNLASKCAM